jgi:hypothetical protein
VQRKLTHMSAQDTQLHRRVCKPWQQACVFTPCRTAAWQATLHLVRTKPGEAPARAVESRGAAAAVGHLALPASAMSHGVIVPACMSTASACGTDAALMIQDVSWHWMLWFCLQALTAPPTTLLQRAPAV